MESTFEHLAIKNILQGIDGMEYLVIPLEHATLSEFLDQQDEG